MKNKVLVSIILFVLIFFSCSEQKNKCVIIGKVIDRPESTHIRLIKSFDDERSSAAILIPIKDNVFRYEFDFEEFEAYSLIFKDESDKGIMVPIIFFPINDTIRFELHPLEDWSENLIDGGEENRLFWEYKKKSIKEFEERTKFINDSLDILERDDKFYTQEMKDLISIMEKSENEDSQQIFKQMDELKKSEKDLTTEAISLIKRQELIVKAMQDEEVEYLQNNISIPNYYTLIQSMNSSKYAPNIYNIEVLKKLQAKYAKKYKNHPYTDYSNEILWSFSSIKPGGDYYDFILPDLTGKEYRVSEIIKDKYAFINIWAPWCGPCIKKNNKIKPILEEYKNKDFVVVGVVSKYKKISDVKAFLEKGAYPWITLIDKPELDSRINERYGIKNSGGISLLINKKGKIVFVNPTAEEVEEVLKENL